MSHKHGRVAGRKKGFTMIELVAVIGILAILLAVAVPQMISYTQAAHRTSAVTEAQVVADAVQRYLYDEKDAGRLTVKTVWRLMNLDINEPDNVIGDYLSGGHKDARIVSVSMDISSGQLKSLVYETKYCRVSMKIDENGNRTLTDEIID